MSLSDSFETHTLKYLLTTDSVTRPTNWYVALSSTDLYTRVPKLKQPLAPHMPVSDFHCVWQQRVQLVCDYSEATASYGTVVAVMIMPASSGGSASDMIAHAQLTTDNLVWGHLPHPCW